MNALRLSAQRSSVRAFAMPRVAFSMSAKSMAGKEDSLHSEGRAEEIETHKQDQLNKKKEGKQHWEDKLASNSESAIKADREETGANTEDSIAKLQEETVKASKK